MSTHTTIKKGINDSCNQLFNGGIITNNQYIKCMSEVDGIEAIRKLQVSEDKIFNISRENKKKKYNDFLDSVNTFKTKLIEKLQTPNIDIDEKKKYISIAILFDNVMTQVLEWIQKKTSERYAQKEDRHYTQLLNYYTKIDTNKDELKKIQSHFDTLDKINEFLIC